MIDEYLLRDLYLQKGFSVKDIAIKLKCSVHKVTYWMLKAGIEPRSISEAIYLMNNRNGDPFKFASPETLEDAELLGFGLGLYWGEGTKADKVSVRLGNTDPELIRKFIEFLVKIFQVKKEDCHFGLQLFTDIEPARAMDFWLKKLKINKAQFYKPTISPSQSKGTYRRKSEYGVLTVYYHNKKLRDLIVSMLPM